MDAEVLHQTSNVEKVVIPIASVKCLFRGAISYHKGIKTKKKLSETKLLVDYLTSPSASTPAKCTS